MVPVFHCVFRHRQPTLCVRLHIFVTVVDHGQWLLWESAVLKFPLNKPNGLPTSYTGRSIKYYIVAVVSCIVLGRFVGCLWFRTGTAACMFELEIEVVCCKSCFCHFIYQVGGLFWIQRVSTGSLRRRSSSQWIQLKVQIRKNGPRYWRKNVRINYDNYDNYDNYNYNYKP